MRPLLAAALLALTVPAAAQVRLGVLANAGYDAGYGAPSVGAGAEVGWEPPGTALRLGVRASADYVFADDLPYAIPFFPSEPVLICGVGLDWDAGDVLGRESSVVRLGAEAVVRWERAAWPVAPYAKVGVVQETERIRRPEITNDYAATDAVVGLGLVWRFVYVEGTYGGGDASRERIAVGVTF